MYNVHWYTCASEPISSRDQLASTFLDAERFDVDGLIEYLRRYLAGYHRGKLVGGYSGHFLSHGSRFLERQYAPCGDGGCNRALTRVHELVVIIALDNNSLRNAVREISRCRISVCSEIMKAYKISIGR